MNIYNDIKFIEIYTKDGNDGHSFGDIFIDIFEDLLQKANIGDVQEFIDVFFNDKRELHNQIDEVDESFSIS